MTDKDPIFSHIKILPAVLVLLLVLFFYFFKVADNFPGGTDRTAEKDDYGITFSTKFCAELGLDWREVYRAMLDDLGVKEIRLPLYWDEIEPQPGVYDFSKYDYLISEGKQRGASFIVNIGWRLPRWPECHAPAWASDKSLANTQARAISMLGAVVEHYKDEPAIVAWQLENEPFFNEFGICPPADEEFFKSELAKIKERDSRPVMVSASGELSLWRKEAKYADLFGTTVYRVVWGPYTGYIRYPIPAVFYRIKARLAGIPLDKSYVIELQAEPWVPKGKMIYLTKEEMSRSMDFEQFKANLRYASKIGFKRSYLWGAEWWYYQYKNGDSRYFEYARELFK